MVPCPERRETQPVGPNARFEQRRPLRVLVPAERPKLDFAHGAECTWVRSGTPTRPRRGRRSTGHARDGAFRFPELPPDAGPKGDLLLGPHHALDRPAV